MSPIGIGPDGTPFVIPTTETIEISETDKVGESFVAELPTDAIKPVSEAKPLVGMDNRIEEARAFNESLHFSASTISLVIAQAVTQEQ